MDDNDTRPLKPAGQATDAQQTRQPREYLFLAGIFAATASLVGYTAATVTVDGILIGMSTALALVGLALAYWTYRTEGAA